MRFFSIPAILKLLAVLSLGALILAPFFHPLAGNAAVGGVAPFLGAFGRWAGAGYAILFSWLPPADAERRELSQARQRLAELEFRQQLSRATDRENRELRERLGLPAPPGWRLVTAQVIARDPALFDRRFRIARGAADGLAPGQAVLAGRHLAGKILSVTAHTALVATLLDPECRISVRVDDLGVAGILAGPAPESFTALERRTCLLDLLPRDPAYAQGMPVSTSGLGTAIPAGLPAGILAPWEPGQIADIQARSYARLRLRPGADLGLRHFVACVVPGTARKEVP